MPDTNLQIVVNEDVDSFERNFAGVIFKLILIMDVWGIKHLVHFVKLSLDECQWITLF